MTELAVGAFLMLFSMILTASYFIFKGWDVPSKDESEYDDLDDDLI